MKFKLNPLTGEFDYTSDSANKEKLNPMTGEFNLVEGDGPFSQIFNPLTGTFNLLSGGGGIIAEVTGNGYINLTNAVANHLMKLKAYGGTEQRNLPSEYTQLDYITLSKSFFDTGITPTTDTDYELKFTVAQINTTQGCMGMLNNSTPTNNFYFMVSSGNKFLSALGTSAITLNDLPTVAADTDYVAKVNGETLTVNGIEATNFTRGTLEATQTINLGCRKNSENNGLTGKLYYFKIWQGGELVAHYIPCKRNSDDVLGYYDIVNDTFGVLLTQYGTPVAGLDAVPTPDTPMDIVCNNGVLKARHQSGLPIGYTLLDYIQSSGTEYIDTGMKGNETTRVEIVRKYLSSTSVSGSGRMFGSRTAAKDDAFVIGTSSGTSHSNTDFFFAYDDQDYIQTGRTIDYDWHKIIHDRLEHSIDGTNYEKDYNLETFETPQNLKIFGYDNAGTLACGIGALKYCKIWNNGVLVRDLIPANDSSNVLGLYDKVNGVFYTNAGTGTFTAGNTVSDPMTIYTDGTTETIEDELGNTATAEMLLKIGDYVDEQEILSGNITRKIGIMVLDGTENWTASGNLFYAGIATDALEDTHSCCCTHFKGVATNASASYDNEIKVGTNATQTVNWTRVQIYPVVGTYSNVTALKQWLTDQYNAGTPVIVLYPLDTPTTESVAGQTMNIPAGDSTIEITQASLDNLGLYAKYLQSN